MLDMNQYPLIIVVENKDLLACQWVTKVWVILEIDYRSSVDYQNPISIRNLVGTDQPEFFFTSTSANWLHEPTIRLSVVVEFLD